MTDHDALIDLANRLDLAVDAKDWPAALAFFTPEIEAALPDAEPARMPAGDLVGAWEANLYAGKPSFHLRGGHVVEVEGDRGRVRSVAYAWNRVPGLAGGDLWEAWGRYDYEAVRQGERWLIASFRFDKIHSRGNEAVPGHRP